MKRPKGDKDFMDAWHIEDVLFCAGFPTTQKIRDASALNFQCFTFVQCTLALPVLRPARTQGFSNGLATCYLQKQLLQFLAPVFITED